MELKRAKHGQNSRLADVYDTSSTANKKRKTNAQETEAEQDKQSNRVTEPEVTSFRFVEDEDEVLLEVKGQTTDFADEGKLASDEEDDDNEVNFNENRQVAVTQNEQMQYRTDGFAFSQRSKEEENKQEEAEMQKFVDFMWKQGLMLVDTAVQKGNPEPVQVHNPT